MINYNTLGIANFRIIISKSNLYIRMKYCCAFLFFFFFILSTGFSQEIKTFRKNIKWEVIKGNNNEIQQLYFDDAIYKAESQFIPFFFQRVSLETDHILKKAEISDTVYKYCNTEETGFLRKNKHIIPKIEVDLDYKTVTERKNPYASIQFIPIIYDPLIDTFKKLISFTIKITGEEKKTFVRDVYDYADNSVLSTGDWYKIKVNKTGIYKIDYEDLEEMGIPVGSIDPRNIRLYGNGGGMLPEANSTFVYDDLQENAIIVAGEDDGKFNQGDYILFYGESPTAWNYDAFDSIFKHTVNLYDDYTYYFITTSIGTGKRITAQSSGSNFNKTITEFNDYDYHETDEYNLLGTGRKWYGDLFDYSTTFNFERNVPGLILDDNMLIRSAFAARSFVDSYYKIYADGDLIGDVKIEKVYNSSDKTFAREKSFKEEYQPDSEKIDIELEYIKTSSNSTGWLDYVEVNYMRELNFYGSQMSFRSAESVGEGNTTKFLLSGADESTRIWNVTDPLNVNSIDGSLIGSDYAFILPTDTLLELIAYDGSSFHQVDFVGKIDNQNLHGINNVDMIIVTHPLFYNEASELADYHSNHDNLSVALTTTKQIYNEFSSGGQDISAIRNFMRMLYNRSSKGNEPKYLLLFGDASYDYKNRIEDNTNFVPSWESVTSLNMIHSYVADDYFVLLDEDEGYNAEGNLDMGVGRLPVGTRKQAQAAVNKIKHYSGSSEAVMKSWRNYITFVADDEDNNLHIEQAQELSQLVKADFKNFNIDKIYLDAYPQVSTPSGQRYPEVTEAINDRMEKGTLVLNYTGHGGELGLAHEQILNISDINNWKNFDNLPVFVTATCEFSRFDDPNRTAAGEYVFLNPDGGAIALFTTTRATFAISNFKLNKEFYKCAFKKTNGEYPRLGDVLRMSKNNSSPSSSNTRKYALLGDPAVALSYPKDSVATLKIDGYEVKETPDTLKALAEVTVTGAVYNNYGDKLEYFNGLLFTTVFDKPSKIVTYGQDSQSDPMTFYLRKNILYKGKAQIINGEFSFSFIVPKDIAYNFGYGRISYYARNDNSDAAGYYENVIVGGYNEDAAQDHQGPLVELYINDTNFVNGGITDKNPVLLAYVYDESGINTVGNGIGHDITAVMDNETDKPFILNDYYEADIGNYKSGTIEYPFFNLDEGEYTLSLKVWDVYNNSADATIEFTVVGSSDFIVERLLNYPNPFYYNTYFVFEHNMPDTELDITIQIFTLQGKLVKTINETVISEGYNCPPIQWNGNNQNGKKLSRGIYIYRMIAKTRSGIIAEKNGKLIIVAN